MDNPKLTIPMNRLLWSVFFEAILIIVFFYLFKNFQDNQDIKFGIVISYVLVACYITWVAYGKILIKNMIEENNKFKNKK